MIRPDVHLPSVVETVCKMYSEGKSYGIIGEAVGLNRNQIAGVIFRLQNSGRLEKRKVKAPSERHPNGMTFKQGHKYHKPRSRPMTYNKSSVVSEKPTNAPKSWNDLKPSECMYAMGAVSDPPKLFCAAPTEDGEPFCSFHHQICYVKPRKDHENRTQP